MLETRVNCDYLRAERSLDPWVAVQCPPSLWDRMRRHADSHRLFDKALLLGLILVFGVLIWDIGRRLMGWSWFRAGVRYVFAWSTTVSGVPTQLHHSSITGTDKTARNRTKIARRDVLVLKYGAQRVLVPRPRSYEVRPGHAGQSTIHSQTRQRLRLKLPEDNFPNYVPNILCCKPRDCLIASCQTAGVCLWTSIPKCGQQSDLRCPRSSSQLHLQKICRGGSPSAPIKLQVLPADRAA